eukprot:g45710.t1
MTELRIPLKTSFCKPDILLVEDNTAYVLDIAVPLESRLDETWTLKHEKYGNDEVVAATRKHLIALGYSITTMKQIPVIISSRGLMHTKSAADLRKIGVSKISIGDLVTIAMAGSISMLTLAAFTLKRFLLQDFREVDDLIKYLDPQYIDRIAIPDAMKLEFILAAVPNYSSKVQALTQIQIQEQDQCNAITEDVDIGVKNNVYLTLTLNSAVLDLFSPLTREINLLLSTPMGILRVLHRRIKF